MHVPQITRLEKATTGKDGQQFLATGKEVALRRWQENPGDACGRHKCDYETVGYLLSGKLQFNLADESVLLEPGDSWLVPAGADHSYRVIESIVAIEATSPPARFAGSH